MKSKILFLLVFVLYSTSIIDAQSLTSYSNSGGRNYKQGIVSNKNLVMITHSVSQDIVSGNSINCNWELYHSDNSYWRVFDLSNDYSISNDFEVVSVDVGIEKAIGGAGTQPVTVNLYTLNGSFVIPNLTLIYSENFTIANTIEPTILNLEFTNPVTVPAGSILVYEFFTPDGLTDHNNFLIGSNTSGESDYSYISASLCAISEPVSFSHYGYTIYIVMNVWGNIIPTSYNANFEVKDESSVALEGAEIIVGIDTLTTDVNGQASFAGLENGTYNYTVNHDTYSEVTGSFDISDSDADVAVEMTVNGIKDLSSCVKFYPNPSTGIFKIAISGTYNLEIINSNGIVIKKETVDNNAVINISDQAQGIYFLKFTNEENTFVKPIIIK